MDKTWMQDKLQLLDVEIQALLIIEPLSTTGTGSVYSSLHTYLLSELKVERFGSG
jgi:hypothetical protein